MRVTVTITTAALMLFVFSCAPSGQNSPPVANAGVDRTWAYSRQALLEGSAADPDGDPILSWQWSVESAPEGSSPGFTDPNRPNPHFDTDQVGYYVLSLKVSDGTYFSLPDTVTIHVVHNKPPIAEASVTPRSGSAPLTVQFSSRGSYDPEGEKLRYVWDFGDGSVSSTDPNPKHLYVTPETYVAQLRVEDDVLNDDLDTVKLTVKGPNDPPVLSPSAAPTSGLAPLKVKFRSNASDPDDDDLTFSWDFADGGTSNKKDPSHKYTAPGTYVARLKVSDGHHDVSKSITVVVDSPTGLSVEKLEFKFKKPDQLQGDVKLWADIAALMPARDDLVVVLVDGIPLVSQSFGDFVPAEKEDDDGDDDEGEYDGTFRLKRRDLEAKISFSEGTLQVQTRNTVLADLDNTNGVQVEVYLGDAAAVESVKPLPAGSKKLIYKRP